MGEPIRSHVLVRCAKYIGTSRLPGELKHLSSQGEEINRDSLSSGERTGISLNHILRDMGL